MQAPDDLCRGEQGEGAGAMSAIKKISTGTLVDVNSTAEAVDGKMPEVNIWLLTS